VVRTFIASRNGQTCWLSGGQRQGDEPTCKRYLRHGDLTAIPSELMRRRSSRSYGPGRRFSPLEVRLDVAVQRRRLMIAPAADGCNRLLRADSSYRKKSTSIGSTTGRPPDPPPYLRMASRPRPSSSSDSLASTESPPAESLSA
jgi:hypothetical protein